MEMYPGQNLLRISASFRKIKANFYHGSGVIKLLGRANRKIDEQSSRSITFRFIKYKS